MTELTTQQRRTIAVLEILCERQTGNRMLYRSNDVTYQWLRELASVTPDGMCNGRIFRYYRGEYRFSGTFQIAADGRVYYPANIPILWTDPEQRIADLRRDLFYTTEDGHVAADMSADADLWAEYDILTGERD